METSSTFSVVALDARGHELGSPLIAHAGSDDHWKPEDDGFTRRFSARQIAAGCASVGNCAAATFSAEALIQFRDALHPERDARIIPASATGLRLTFDQLPRSHYDVGLTHVAPGSVPFGYGFDVSLEPMGAPANHLFYAPGESVSFRVVFKDGQGNRLYPPGTLPTFAAVQARQDDAGLRYLDLQLKTRLYYALKHRESNLLLVLSGPTDKLKTPTTVVDPNLLFGPQVPFATPAVDGFTAIGATIPSAGILFGGFADPSLWQLPVSDVVTFTIPPDAAPGTYVGAVKARREFAGEALNRAGSVDIQIGQPQHTSFVPKTACTSCHSQERTRFSTLLHGIGDRRTCFGCHSALGIEPDNVLDIRVHTIHDRSDRFGANIRNCSNCHLASPASPARGLLEPTRH
jgi:predicted CXXCH cytochrome family protein